MRALYSLLLLIGRICIGAIFLFAGVSKLLFFDQTAQYMATKGLPSIPLLLIAAALLEILGSISVIFGYKTRFGAGILLLFLIPTTIIFHNFWALSGTDYTIQQIMFFKNLAIFGGLIYVLCHGSGGCAFDACICKHKLSADDKKPS